jgi:hypothetical protein
MLFAIAGIVLFTICIGWAIHGILEVDRRWDRSLADAQALLESAELGERGVVKGNVGGRATTIELTTRGGDSNAEAWTEIRVSHQSPTKLALRPQTLPEEAVVAMSRAVDVRVGDGEFDDAFVVDGAPADEVRRILDDVSLRNELRALAPVEVEDRDAMIQIAKKGWLDGKLLEALLSAVVTLAARLDGTSLVLDARARSELAALAEARARRLRLRKRLLVAFIVCFVAAFVAMTATTVRR